jgi:acetyl esterase/lipase
MTVPDVHPDLRTGIAALPPLSVPGWGIRPFRAMMGLFKPRFDRSGVDVVDTRTPSSAGAPVDVRVHLPAGTDGPLPVLVWAHGGGLVVGDHRDGWGYRFARDLGIAVASSSYRLAPEHPFPAALDDLTATTRWALDGGYGRFDGSRVAVGGESAGGGLAAALTQRLHDSGVDLAAQLLVAPMLDDRTAVRSDIGRNEHPVWTKGSNHTGWSAYLGVEPGGPVVPEHAVPARRRDLTGLAPAWIGVGTADLFLDECVAYAERLEAAGVDCALEVVDGAPHGFPTIAPDAEVSRAFVASAMGFLGERLGVG